MTPADKARYERTSRLRLLFQKWTSTRKGIDYAHNERAALGSVEAMKPSIMRKLTRWMEQIGVLENKERDIISEIDAIERKHRQMRKDKKLREAKPADQRPETEAAAPSPKRRKGLDGWAALLFLLLMASRSNANKKG